MSPIESPMGAAYGGIQQGEVENCIGWALNKIFASHAFSCQIKVT